MTTLMDFEGNANEFKAYCIPYFLHTANRTALNDIMATLTPTEKKDKGIKHARGEGRRRQFLRKPSSD